MNMPASAYYFRLKGSYRFNNVFIEYRQLGPGYESFGNPYLTNNIREFNVKDRLSLLGRRLMFVAGYQYRDNKLNDFVIFPTIIKTYSFNTTLVPGPGAPSIVANIQSIAKTNGIDSIDTDKYGNFLRDNRENSQAINLMASINIPGSFKNFTSISSFNIILFPIQIIFPGLEKRVTFFKNLRQGLYRQLFQLVLILFLKLTLHLI